MSKKKITEAKKLAEKIKGLDELEMYSVYQILEKNKANLTKNMNGVYFDLLSLPVDIYKTLDKFVNQTIKRKTLIVENNVEEST